MVLSLLEKFSFFRESVKAAHSIADQLIVDKDQAIELKAQLDALEKQGERMAMENERLRDEAQHKERMLREQSYQEELKTKTTTRVDAFHKLSRTLQSFTALLMSGFIVFWFGTEGIEITPQMVTILGGSNIIGGIYAYRKGVGAPVKS